VCRSIDALTLGVIKKKRCLNWVTQPYQAKRPQVFLGFSKRKFKIGKNPSKNIFSPIFEEKITQKTTDRPHLIFFRLLPETHTYFSQAYKGTSANNNLSSHSLCINP